MDRQIVGTKLVLLESNIILYMYCFVYFFSKNEIEITKSLFEKLSKHITQHNENIEKVKLSKSQLINEFNNL